MKRTAAQREEDAWHRFLAYAPVGPVSGWEDFRARALAGSRDRDEWLAVARELTPHADAALRFADWRDELAWFRAGLSLPRYLKQTELLFA